jgi:hypothetical protein
VEPLNFGSASSSVSTCLGRRQKVWATDTVIQQTISKFRVGEQWGYTLLRNVGEFYKIIWRRNPESGIHGH